MYIWANESSSTSQAIHISVHLMLYGTAAAISRAGREIEASSTGVITALPEEARVKQAECGVILH